MKASCFLDNTEMKAPRQRAGLCGEKMWQKCGISCLKRQDLERIGKNGKKNRRLDFELKSPCFHPISGAPGRT